MAQAAELTVSDDGFLVLDGSGTSVEVDIYGYMTRTPGFLFYPGAEPFSRWSWEGNGNGLYNVYATVTSVVWNPVTEQYSGSLTGLDYYKLVEGVEVFFGRLSIDPTGFISDYYYGEQADELGRIVTDHITEYGMVVNGSDQVDQFSGQGFGLTGAISWALGAGADRLNSQNEGADTVDAGADGDHIETLGGDDIVHAGSGNDEAWLGLGDDRFYGEAGDDFVRGDEGNDLLDGGAGLDELRGSAGDDTMIVDNAGDVVVEYSGEGSDRVLASVDYVLAAGAEVELMTTTANSGTAAIDLTGNEIAQTIRGNAGDNVLDDGGGAGVDTLQGLGGNDYYRIGNSAAVIVEAAGGGNDAVATGADYVLKAGVEVETLRTNANAGTAAIDLTGNEVAQTIRGNAGSNILDGKGGNDILQGLTGEDFFVFSSALGAGNVDTIADFVAVDDTILLENAVFTKLTAAGALNPAFFRANTAGIAGDGNDYILFDTTDGTLYYDADGNGAGARIQFATSTGAPAVTAIDFVIV